MRKTGQFVLRLCCYLYWNVILDSSCYFYFSS